MEVGTRWHLQAIFIDLIIGNDSIPIDYDDPFFLELESSEYIGEFSHRYATNEHAYGFLNPGFRFKEDKW